MTSEEKKSARITIDLKQEHCDVYLQLQLMHRELTPILDRMSGQKEITEEQKDDLFSRTVKLRDLANKAVILWDRDECKIEETPEQIRKRHVEDYKKRQKQNEEEYERRRAKR